VNWKAPQTFREGFFILNKNKNEKN
jgi:hypothetical protein